MEGNSAAQNTIAAALVKSAPGYASSLANGTERAGILRRLADTHFGNQAMSSYVFNWLTELEDTEQLVRLAKRDVTLKDSLPDEKNKYVQVLIGHGSCGDLIEAATQLRDSQAASEQRSDLRRMMSAYYLLCRADMSETGISLRREIAQDAYYHNSTVLGNVLQEDREALARKVLKEQNPALWSLSIAYILLQGTTNPELQERRIEIAKTFIAHNPESAEQLFREHGLDDKGLWLELGRKQLENGGYARAFRIFDEQGYQGNEFGKIGMLALEARARCEVGKPEMEGEPQKRLEVIIRAVAMEYLENRGSANVVHSLMPLQKSDCINRKLALPLARAKNMEAVYERLDHIRSPTVQDQRFLDGLRKYISKKALAEDKRFPFCFGVCGAKDERTLNIFVDMALPDQPGIAYETAIRFENKGLTAKTRQALIDSDALGALKTFKMHNDNQGVQLAEKKLTQGFDESIARTMLFGK